MKLTLKSKLFTPHKKKKAEHQLLVDIKQLVDKINSVNELFDYVSDGEMVEYYIHELNALHAQYAYLLRRVREENLKCDYEPVGFSERLYGKL